MTDPEATIYRHHTGRNDPPTGLAREGFLVVGRRGGKSLFSAALAVWAATFRDYRPFLKPGERAVVMVLAADKDQAQVVFGYIEGFFANIPMLEALVDKPTKG